MHREQFHARLSEFDRKQVNTVLWTVYWRGPAALRQRIETALDAVEQGTRPTKPTPPPVDPAHIRAEVEQFVALARSGAYMGRDRRVSPRERTRWRFTFARLAADAQRALRTPDPSDAITAVEQLIDCACETADTDYFRSEDPVEAARFVVSDVVALLWATMREHLGFVEFARRAAPQLIRWESRHGWTRVGWGRVSEKETSLATVLVEMLQAPDAWLTFADAYLDALDDSVSGRRWTRGSKEWRTDALAEWNALLLDRLVDNDDEDRLHRLVNHPAIAAPGRRDLKARMTSRRGED